MNILLLLLAFMGIAYASEQEEYTSTQVMIDLKLLGGGGGYRQPKKRIRTIMERLVLPANPSLGSPITPMVCAYRPSSHRWLTNHRDEGGDDINLRGHIEAQDIDIRPHMNWWDRFMQWISGVCGSRIIPMSPPPLERQQSYYPGRLEDSKDHFPEE